MPRPTDDGRHADSALEKRKLAAPVVPAVTAPAESPHFGAVPVVGLEDDDRIVGQSLRIEERAQFAQVVVERGDERGVHAPRIGQSGVVIQPLLLGLQRVVRDVDRPVEEEGLPAIPRPDELLGFAQGLLGEEPPLVVDLLSVAPEVVDIGAAPVIEMRVAVDAPAQESPEIVEAPVVGGIFGTGAQVPLADAGRPVAVGLHALGDGLLFGREARPARIAGQAGARGELPGHQAGARGGAHGRGVELREAHAARGQRIHVGRTKVGRPVAVHVQRTVVVRVDDDDVGRRCLRRSRTGQQQAAGTQHELSPIHIGQFLK